MTNCETINAQLNSLNRQRDQVEAQLENFGTASQRRQLLNELKTLNHEIAVKQKDYQNCLHPPAPKPDLVAKTFQVKPNHAAKTLAIAGVVQNDGDGPARGPFAIVLGVTYLDRSGKTITRARTLQIPATVTIEGHGTQYVTESIQDLPLLYRSENPKFQYDLEMIVDSENQISEVSESNNYLGFRYWTVSPASATKTSHGTA